MIGAKLNRYMQNVGKSTVYTAAEVLSSTLFPTIKDFKETNADLFTNVYSGIRNYRTTYTRAANAIKKSKIYEASEVGIKNLIQDIKTGDFYNKEREETIAEKFGGDLLDMSMFDISDSDFDWDNLDDVSDGDKVITTAIRKNSKISTAMISESVAKGHKAIIDTSRDNTNLLYVQGEKMYSRLNSGLDNITSILKVNGENAVKNNVKISELHAKFYTNIEQKVTQIAQTLLQIQKNQETSTGLNKTQEKSRENVRDINSIVYSGVPDLAKLGKAIKKNATRYLDDITQGMYSSIMGEEDGNKLAMFTAAPVKEIVSEGMKSLINKKFTDISNELDETIQGIVPTIFSKLNTAKNNEEGGGLSKILGTVFGLDLGSTKSFKADRYNKGAIPFDSVTKIAITDVMPYYLRKIAAAITGDGEAVFNYKTGKWTTIRTAQKAHEEDMKSIEMSAIKDLTSVLEQYTGKNYREMGSDYTFNKNFKEDWENLAKAVFNARGDFKSIYDEYMRGERFASTGEDFTKLLKALVQDYQYYEKDKYDQQVNRSTGVYTGSRKVIDRSRGKNGIRTGVNNRSKLMNIAQSTINAYQSQNRKMDEIQEGNSIEALLYREGILGVDSNRDDYGKFHKNSDISRSPLANVLLMVEDRFGYTMYDYMNAMTTSLEYIKHASLNIADDISDGIYVNNLNNPDGSGNNKNKDRQRRRKSKSKKSRDYDNIVKTALRNKNSLMDKNGSRSYNNLHHNADNDRDVNETNLRNKFNERHANDKVKVENINNVVGLINQRINKKAEEKLNDLNASDKEKKDLVDFLASIGIVASDAEKQKYKEMTWDSTKTFKENMKGLTTTKDKFFKLRKYATDIINAPWKSATDMVINLDKWVYGIFFGKDAKVDKDGEKIGLLGSIKIGLENGFNHVVDFITDKWGDKIDEAKKWFSDKVTGRVGKFLFGEGSDGERTGGIFSTVSNTIFRWGEEAKEAAKRKKEEQKRKEREKNGDTDDDTTTTDNNPSPSGGSNNNGGPANEIEKEAGKMFEQLQQDWGLVKDAALAKYKEYRDIYTAYKQTTDPVSAKIYFDEMKKYEDIMSYANKKLRAGKIEKEDYNLALSKANEYMNTKKSNIGSYSRLSEKGKQQYEERYKENVKLIVSYLLQDTRDKKANPTVFLKKLNKLDESIDLSPIYTMSPNDLARTFGMNEQEIFQVKFLESMKTGDSSYILDNISNNGFLNELNKKIVKKKRDLKKGRSSKKNRGKIKLRGLDNSGIKDRITSNIINPLIGTEDETKVDNLYKIIQQAISAGSIDKFAKGGINTSGRTIASVVSSGEIVNGRVVPPGGPYITTIPHGGYVINPANQSKINKQASEEQQFIRNLKSNAAANDGLQNISTDENGQRIMLLMDENGKRISVKVDGNNKALNPEEQELINKYFIRQNNSKQDNSKEAKEVKKWMNDPENNKLAGEVITRGGIGAGVGLLLGHPLLAAAIGMATGLNKSSSKFSNMIFGKMGEDGKRDDSGLISSKIQEAFPSATKFGIGGAIAGLLTPLGPVGGLLVGGALGFAKNSETVQEALFGNSENGFQDFKEKALDKLPGIGLGAGLGALIGPFGLVGGALLGGASGFVATTDTFKDFVFGKKDHNDNDNRHGGIAGALKEMVDPLKRFGKDLTKAVVKSIFGEKTEYEDENGEIRYKHVGGILGAINEGVVEPMSRGITPILESVKRGFQDFIDSAKNKLQDHRDKHIGERLGSRLLEKVTGGAIKGVGLAEGLTKLALTPFSLAAKGVEKFGNRRRRKSISKGTGDWMSASTRVGYRDEMDISGDDYEALDRILAAGQQDEDVLKNLRNMAAFASGGDLDKDVRAKEAESLSNFLGGEIDAAQAGRIMKKINKGDMDAAKRMLENGKLKNSKGEIVNNETIGKIFKRVRAYESNVQKAKDMQAKMDEEGGFDAINQAFKNAGFDINITDKKQARNIMKYMDRELKNKNYKPQMSEMEKNTSAINNAVDAMYTIVKLMLHPDGSDLTQDELKILRDRGISKISGKIDKTEVEPGQTVADTLKRTKAKTNGNLYSDGKVHSFGNDLSSIFAENLVTLFREFAKSSDTDSRSFVLANSAVILKESPDGKYPKGPDTSLLLIDYVLINLPEAKRTSRNRIRISGIQLYSEFTTVGAIAKGDKDCIDKAKDIIKNYKRKGKDGDWENFDTINQDFRAPKEMKSSGKIKSTNTVGKSASKLFNSLKHPLKTAKQGIGVGFKYAKNSIGNVYSNAKDRANSYVDTKEYTDTKFFRQNEIQYDENGRVMVDENGNAIRGKGKKKTLRNRIIRDGIGSIGRAGNWIKNNKLKSAGLLALDMINPLTIPTLLGGKGLGRLLLGKKGEDGKREGGLVKKASGAIFGKKGEDGKRHGGLLGKLRAKTPEESFRAKLLDKITNLPEAFRRDKIKNVAKYATMFALGFFGAPMIGNVIKKAKDFLSPIFLGEKEKNDDGTESYKGGIFSGAVEWMRKKFSFLTPEGLKSLGANVASIIKSQFVKTADWWQNFLSDTIEGLISHLPGILGSVLSGLLKGLWGLLKNLVSGAFKAINPFSNANANQGLTPITWIDPYTGKKSELTHFDNIDSSSGVPHLDSGDPSTIGDAYAEGDGSGGGTGKSSTGAFNKAGRILFTKSGARAAKGIGKGMSWIGSKIAGKGIPKGGIGLAKKGIGKSVEYLGRGLSKLGNTGSKLQDAVNGTSKAAEEAAENAAKKGTKEVSKSVLNKATGGAADDVVEGAAKKGSKLGAEAAEGAVKKSAKVGAEGAAKGASKLGKAAEKVAKKPTGLLGKFINFVKDKLVSLFKNSFVQDILKKLGSKFAKTKAAKAALTKAIKNAPKVIAEKLGKRIASLGTKKLAWLVAKLGIKTALGFTPLKLIGIGLDIWSFISGYRNADEIFGIEEPTFFQKVLGGFVRFISDKLTLGLAEDGIAFIIKTVFGMNDQGEVAGDSEAEAQVEAATVDGQSKISSSESSEEESGSSNESSSSGGEEQSTAQQVVQKSANTSNLIKVTNEIGNEKIDAGAPKPQIDNATGAVTNGQPNKSTGGTGKENIRGPIGPPDTIDIRDNPESFQDTYIETYDKVYSKAMEALIKEKEEEDQPLWKKAIKFSLTGGFGGMIIRKMAGSVIDSITSLGSGSIAGKLLRNLTETDEEKQTREEKERAKELASKKAVQDAVANKEHAIILSYKTKSVAQNQVQQQLVNGRMLPQQPGMAPNANGGQTVSANGTPIATTQGQQNQSTFGTSKLLTTQQIFNGQTPVGYPVNSNMNGAAQQQQGEASSIQQKSDNLGFGASIDGAVNQAMLGFDNIEQFVASFDAANANTNNQIAMGKLTATMNDFWTVVPANSGNPTIDALLRTRELLGRLIKAPFSMISDSLNGMISTMSRSADGSIDNNAKQFQTTDQNSEGGIWSTFKSGIKSVWSGIKSMFGSGKGSTGRGGNGINDPNHIYQRNYSESYNIGQDSEKQTLADSGCGPAAAATVMNQYGIKGDFKNAAKYALNNGYKEVDGGTYPEYFADYLGKNGVATQNLETNKDVVKSLLNNKPVILMGRNESNSKDTPYGSDYSHYVVATGINKNGKIIVEDSEDTKAHTTYDLKDTLQNTSVKIATARGVYGRATANKNSNTQPSNYTSVLSNYVTSSLGALYGPYYDALFGTNTKNSNNKNNNNSSSYNSSNLPTNSNSTNNNGTKAKTQGVKGSIGVDDDVRTNCGYTVEQLRNAMSKVSSCTDFVASTYSKCAMDVENKYGINALFTLGVAIYEQGWDEANVTDYNPFNIMGSNSDNGRWADYSGWDNAFDSFGQLMTTHSCYFLAGNVTPHDIGLHYCPPGGENGDSDEYTWPNGVVEIANMIVNRIDGAGSGKGKGRRYSAKGIYSSKFGRAKISWEMPQKQKQEEESTSESKDLSLFERFSTNEQTELGTELRDVLTNNAMPEAETNSEAWDQLSDEEKTSYYAGNTKIYTDKIKEVKDEKYAPGNLMDAFSNYTTDVLKNLFGPFYDALFAEKSDSSNSNGSNSNSSTSGNNDSSSQAGVNNSGQTIGPFLQEQYCSSEFGEQRDNGPHPGIDICTTDGNTLGKALYSVCGGKVIEVRKNYEGTTGNMVAIECLTPCDDSLSDYVGKIFTYMHLDKVCDDIEVNTPVSLGQQIGWAGNTGESRGAHCHFQITSNGTFASCGATAHDPGPYLVGHTIAEGERWTCDKLISNAAGSGRDKGNKKKSGRGSLTFNSDIHSRRRAAEKIEQFINSKKRGRLIENGYVITKDNRSTGAASIRYPYYPGNIDKDNPTTERIAAFGRGTERGAYATHQTSNSNTIAQTFDQVYDDYGNPIPRINNINLDQSQIINVLNVIAENTMKTDRIIELLAAIVTNTDEENDKSSSKKSNTALKSLLKAIGSGGRSSTSAPLTGLDQVLNNSGSNISDGIYTIARQ